VLVILGESGSGKTTLLNVLAGLTDYEGQITGNVAPVSMVFQKDFLVPNLTVEENLKLVCKDKDVLSALDSVGLLSEAKLYPKSLSAGMSRRVALLRGFLYNSTLMLMDEPTNSLDIGLKHTVYQILKEQKKNYPKTIVVVTHDVEEALSIADRVVVLKQGEIVYSYDFKTSVEERTLTDSESNQIRKELLSVLL
jgi:NitT/TauT family transport system ATP-binding protein